MKKLKKIRTKVNNFFPVILEEDSSGGYVAICPLLEGCYSQGDTIEEALKNIKEAIALCCEDRRVKKQVPSKKYSLHMVEV